MTGATSTLGGGGAAGAALLPLLHPAAISTELHSTACAAARETKHLTGIGFDLNANQIRCV
jgi:hypothetical protein